MQSVPLHWGLVVTPDSDLLWSICVEQYRAQMSVFIPYWFKGFYPETNDDDKGDDEISTLNILKTFQNGHLFCRRYFQMHFRERQYLYFDERKILPYFWDESFSKLIVIKFPETVLHY